MEIIQTQRRENCIDLQETIFFVNTQSFFLVFYLRAGDWRAVVPVPGLTGRQMTLEEASLLLVTLTAR